MYFGRVSCHVSGTIKLESWARHSNSKKKIAKARSRVRKEWARKGRYAIIVHECPHGLHTRGRAKWNSLFRAHYATRMTGARVLTRIRPRVFAPYDASTRSVVKPRYTLKRRRIHPVSNYYDKLHAGDALTSTPANFAELIWQSHFMFFINFDFTYTPISIATRSTVQH